MSPDGSPQPSWNLVKDAGQILEYHFMVNALIAAGLVAVTAGVVGWMMVVRRETFAGHTLSMMAFPGAAAAALVAVPAAWGYLLFCGGEPWRSAWRRTAPGAHGARSRPASARCRRRRWPSATCS